MLFYFVLLSIAFDLVIRLFLRDIFFTLFMCFFGFLVLFFAVNAQSVTGTVSDEKGMPFQNRLHPKSNI